MPRPEPPRDDPAVALATVAVPFLPITTESRSNRLAPSVRTSPSAPFAAMYRARTLGLPALCCPTQTASASPAGDMATETVVGQRLPSGQREQRAELARQRHTAGLDRQVIVAHPGDHAAAVVVDARHRPLHRRVARGERLDRPQLAATEPDPQLYPVVAGVPDLVQGKPGKQLVLVPSTATAGGACPSHLFAVRLLPGGRDQQHHMRATLLSPPGAARLALAAMLRPSGPHVPPRADVAQRGASDTVTLITGEQSGG